jgi:hypothetical protein
MGDIKYHNCTISQILAFNGRIKPKRLLLVMSPITLYGEHRRVGEKMVGKSATRG